MTTGLRTRKLLKAAVSRLPPEGAWDYEGDLEDTASIQDNVVAAEPTPSLARQLLFHTKENCQMNGEQIAGTIRTVGAMLTGWIVGAGIMPAELWAQVVPVAAGLAVWGWSLWSNKNKKVVK